MVWLNLLQVNQNLEGSAEPGSVHLIESCKIEEVELLGKGEILLQQPITKKAAVRVWQHSLLPAETHLLQGVRWKKDRGRIGARRKRPQRNPKHVQEQAFIKFVNGAAVTGQIKPQRFYGHLTESKTAGTLHFDLNNGGNVGSNTSPCKTIRSRYRRSLHSKRPERYWIASPERAELAVNRPVVNRYSTGNSRRCGDTLSRVELKLSDSLRRYRFQEVRIKHFHEGLGDLRKLIIQFVMHPSAQ